MPDAPSAIADQRESERIAPTGLGAFAQGGGPRLWQWVGLWLLAFAPALLFALQGAIPRSDDSDVYWRMGLTLARTGSFADEAGNLVAYWPPGMAAYVAAVVSIAGPNQLALTVTNLALHGLVLLLTARLGWKLGGARIGAAAMVMQGLLWENLRQAPLVLSELPYTVLLLGGFLVMLEARGRWRVPAWFAAGLVLGVGALVRSTAMLWVPFAIGWIVIWPWWTWGRKVVPILLLAVAFAGFLIPTGLWAARNYRLYHFFFPISLNSGENLGLSNNRFGTIGYVMPDSPVRAGIRMNSQDPVKNYQRGREEFFRTWRRMPVDSALRCIPRLYFTMFRFQPWFANREILQHPYYEVLETFFSFQWICFMGFAVAGFAFTRGNRSGVELAVLSLILYWLLLHSVILCDPRYRIPLTPFLAPYAAHCLLNVVPRLRRLAAVMEKESEKT